MDRTVIVTGATRGIGRALTNRLVELGHTVVGCGRSQTGVDELAAEFGKPHRFAAVDVAVWPEVEAWAASVLSEMPPPDLLINNAGVINRHASELLGRVRGCKPLTRGVGEKRDGFPAFSQYRAQRRITFGIK